MDPPVSFDESLQEKLMKVEEDLLEAALDSTDRPSAMTDFVERLASLMQSATHGIANRLLSSATITLVRRVASSASSMAENLHEMERRKREIESQRQAQLADVFARFSLRDSGDESDDNHTAVDEPTTSRCGSKPFLPKRTAPAGPRRGRPLNSRLSSEETLVSPSSPADDESLSSHIPGGYEWLKSNIWNPYPSNAVKSAIAASSGVPFKTVSDWFTNARRRIGWSRVVKHHFKGQRTIAVDAASRVFSKDSQSSSLPVDAVNDLLEVERVLRRLYKGKLEASEYAKQLPVVSPSEFEPTRQRPLHKPTKKRRAEPNTSEEPSRSRKRSHSSDETDGDDVTMRNKRVRPLPRRTIASDSSGESSSGSITPDPLTPSSMVYRLDLPTIDPSRLLYSANQTPALSVPSTIELSQPYHETEFEWDLTPSQMGKRRFSYSDEADGPAAKRAREDNFYNPDVALEQAVSLDGVFEGQDITQVIAALDFTLPSQNSVLSDPLLDGNFAVDLYDWNCSTAYASLPELDFASGLGNMDFGPLPNAMISGDAANAVNLPFEELASQCTENYRLPSPFRSEITPLYEESLLTLDTSSFARLLSGLESDNDIVGDNVESHLLYPPIIAPTDPSDLDREGKKEILRQLKEEATKIELELAIS